jgi:DNA-binding transcriptional MerR regulator
MPLKIDGKEYDIPGVGRIMLYPIGKVSQSLTDAGFPRDTQTIRKWELAKIIPKAPYRVGDKRLYSQDHIDCIVDIVKECSIRRGLKLESTNFTQRLFEEWANVTKKLKGEK